MISRYLADVVLYHLVRRFFSRSMLLTTVFTSLMASVAMGASLTKVNYPNNATSKVEMSVFSTLAYQYTCCLHTDHH